MSYNSWSNILFHILKGHSTGQFGVSLQFCICPGHETSSASQLLHLLLHLAAVLISQIDLSMCIYFGVQMYSIRSLPTMLYRERAEEDGIEDMTQLEYKLLKLFMLNNLLIKIYNKWFLYRELYNVLKIKLLLPGNFMKLLFYSTLKKGLTEN